MSPDRPFAVAGILALGIALGGVLVGHGLLIPLLTSGDGLVDQNLARALANPLELRVGDAVLVACLVLAAVSHRWGGAAVTTTVTLVAACLAAVDRLLLLPRMHDAYGRVDLVAGRPADAFAELSAAAGYHTWATVLCACLLVVTSVLVSTPRAADKAKTRPEASASPVPAELSPVA